MNDERDGALQRWFDRSAEELSGADFMRGVTKLVRRRERRLRWQRYAAGAFALFSFCLLLSELIAAVDVLAAPRAAVALGGELWPVLVALVLAGAYRLISHSTALGRRSL